MARTLDLFIRLVLEWDLQEGGGPSLSWNQNSTLYFGKALSKCGMKHI